MRRARAITQHDHVADQPSRMRGLGLADLCLEQRRIVDAAMHGPQDGRLGREAEMLQLALVRVIRVADTARPRQAFDERIQRFS